MAENEIKRNKQKYDIYHSAKYNLLFTSVQILNKSATPAVY